ncbi:MAG: TonB-dependent receptor plug domain-containing protein, partial [Parahaliea sp.]
MLNRKVVMLTWLALAAPPFSFGSALAQDAGSGHDKQNSSLAIEEIVVTSRKRGAEVLQDVPATITAFGADTLEKMRVLNFDQMAYQVPGLTFADEGAGQKRYVLRGIQSAGQQQVAVYYDEVPIPGVQAATGNSGSQTTDLKL